MRNYNLICILTFLLFFPISSIAYGPGQGPSLIPDFTNPFSVIYWDKNQPVKSVKPPEKNEPFDLGATLVPIFIMLAFVGGMGMLEYNSNKICTRKSKERNNAD